MKFIWTIYIMDLDVYASWCMDHVCIRCGVCWSARIGREQKQAEKCSTELEERMWGAAELLLCRMRRKVWNRTQQWRTFCVTRVSFVRDRAAAAEYALTQCTVENTIRVSAISQNHTKRKASSALEGERERGASVLNNYRLKSPLDDTQVALHI